ncbi:N-acetylglucosamine-6-phosphate deacetylase [Paenibacillus allorhizoplanae]|uniref:N-acetylglucosamine-6-phosphate deacetylase n=2 Tax=Paenibacillus allorhizoplanae TaxID=2905648 RepID=A0ABM9D199_9BACL|nr:amidohydrolase family protein [Paenibacillus allorhizoplanae]CAH1231773.1 N-acetylglucosamine-6-phosphate deacetylase [Paenibacillus allorhizoplanae]
MVDKTSIICARHYATGAPVAITVHEGRIDEVMQVEESDGLPIVAPGLVDLQINGYAGLDFNQLPLQAETVSQIIRKLWREGVTSSYPTVITNTPDAIASALGSIASACEADPATEQGIAGIHLEGPFISPDDGARGAHRLDDVRPPDWDLFCRWQEAAGGRIKIVTLSPEWPDSAAFIKRCVDSGVIVSIGHTAADASQIGEAVAAGARMSTHLGNGAHLMLPRHPNYLWEQLAQDDLWSCVIADGFHLPDQVLKVVLKVKGEQALLVSDAVAISGLEPGVYKTHIGGDVVLTSEGKLHLAADPRLLAGSAQMLLWGIAHLSRRGIAAFPSVWEMASTRPARLMGLPIAEGLSVGAPADFVLLDRVQADGRIPLRQTYKAGRLVYDEGSEI